jgi:hypothetical protein
MRLVCPYSYRVLNLIPFSAGQILLELLIYLTNVHEALSSGIPDFDRVSGVKAQGA